MEKNLKENNNRFRTEKGRKEWVEDSHHWVGFELTSRNRELERAKFSIHELQKMVDRSTQMKIEVRLDFEAQISTSRKLSKHTKMPYPFSAYKKRR